MPSGAATGEKVLRVGIASPVQDLDPHDVMHQAGRLVLAQIFESPYRLKDEGRVEPVLFDDMLRRGAGHTTYLARLREGLRFSDGTEVTAKHVADSFARKRPLGDEATIDVDGDQIVFELRRPNPRFELMLSHLRCALMLDRGGKLLGTGPYVIADDSTPERIHLVRNSSYRAEVPIAEVVLQTFSQSESGRSDDLLRAVQKQEVDFTMALSRDEVGQVSGPRKLFRPGSSTGVLFFNTDRRPFSDAVVRRAFSLAIDRYALTGICYENPAAFTARSLLPPTLSHVSFSDGLHFDPDGALAELARSGLVHDAPLKMLTVWGPRPYLPQPRAVAEAIAQQLAKLEANVEVVPTTDTRDYHDSLQTGDYDLLLGGWIADTPDPADFLDAMLWSKLIPVEGRPTTITCNLSRWIQPDVDDMLRDFREQRNDAILERVLARVRDEVPLVPLMYGPTVIVHSWRVQNFEPSPVDLPSFAALDLE